MRVLLINPPFYRLMGSHFNGINLGLSYIGAALAQLGYEVKIYNADYLPSSEYLSQDEIFNSFEAYREAHGLANPIWQEVQEAIAGYTPDIVGIGMQTATFRSAQIVARLAKQAGVRKVAVGGVHPTLAPQHLQGNSDIDWTVLGEGEGILPLLMSTNPDKIMVQGIPILDLDKLAFPLRDSRYYLNDMEFADRGNIITGRGCPFRCAFCASPAIWKGQVHLRSISNVLDEVQSMLDSGVKLIHFCDDTFNLNAARTASLLTGAMERGMEFEYVCDARADRMTEGLAELMATTGCKRIKIGVESGSDRMLKAIHKGITVAQIRHAVELIHTAGIPLTIYLIAGFPGETDEDLKATIKLAKWIDADYYSLSIFTPYYGTELGRRTGSAESNHWEDYYHQSGRMIANDSLSRDMVEEFLSLNKGGRFRV